MPLTRTAAFLVAAFCFVLTACVSTPLPLNNPPVDYSRLPAIPFDVAEVMVINDASIAPLTAELAGKFGPSPEDALREWAERRIQPVGADGSFTIIIKDANFAAARLPIESGFRSYFERQQAARWDAYLNVLIAVENSQLPPAEITINLRTSQTLPEDASAEEKRQTYNSILNKLMTLFDAEAQKQMGAYFRAYYR